MATGPVEVVSVRSDVRPVVGEVADYTNSDVQRTIRSIGEFVYGEDLAEYG